MLDKLILLMCLTLLYSVVSCFSSDICCACAVVIIVTVPSEKHYDVNQLMNQ